MSVTRALTLGQTIGKYSRAHACNNVRAGSTLVELLVALPVGALLSMVAIALLLDTHHLARRLQSNTEIARELRQAGAVLTSEIRPLSATDIITWSDTSLEMNAIVGSGVVCASPTPSTVDLLPLNGTDALRTAWFATPQAGDNVLTLSPDQALIPADANWQSSTLTNVASTSISSCNGHALLTLSSSSSSRVMRLTLSSATTSPDVGTPVRITRRIRYSLYKASGNLWYLGRKSLSPTGWSTIQPVAGPLEHPARHGLLIELHDVNNNTLALGDPTPPTSVALEMHSVSEWLRAPGHPGATDSLSLHITLRGATPMAAP